MGAEKSDFTAHQLDEFFADRQPKAGSAVQALGRTVGLHKFFKDGFLALFFDAYAGINDLKEDFCTGSCFGITLNIDADGSLVSKFQGVSNQVDQDLLNQAFIPQDIERYIVLTLTDELQFFLFYAGSLHVVNGVRHFP